MSVLIETSLGVLVVDLNVKECPKACLNFIKLCKIKYYNNCLFYDVQKDFLAQTGDPDNTGRGSNSIYGVINGEKERYFQDEIHPQLRHNKLGIISTANLGPNLNTSTFFIQLTDRNLPYLNEKHTVFGKVEEGLEVLEKINKAFVDKDNRPLQNIRIKHTVVLDDPFKDPEGLIVPSKSPEPVRDLEYNRLEDDFNLKELYKDQETEEKVKEKLQEHEAKNRALVLEMLEDLPDADVKPPENVLFVCKINPVTQDDDLELIFSRFGPIKSCQIIRDWKTGESLQYAFIEFEKVEDCERAFFKMNGVVIDERRIKVDFSQSVAKLWHNVKRGSVNLQDTNEKKTKPNELVFQNENQKLELRHNRNFMTDNKNFRLVFEGNRPLKFDDSQINYERDILEIEKDTKERKHRSRSKSKSRKRSRSRDHKRKHKDRDYRDKEKDRDYRDKDKESDRYRHQKDKRRDDRNDRHHHKDGHRHNKY
jgi:peptidyl-prolyl cis-trans isomerase-like 4